ncbi:MAG: hypothetical protein ACTHMU_26270 [Thermomicrobiales bacterium]
MRGCSGWIGLAAVFMLLFGPFGYAVVMLEKTGVVVPGEITGKRELINAGSTGSWSRQTLLDVRYQAHDRTAPEPASLVVTPATYDRLTVGETVPVRYVPNRMLRDLIILPVTRYGDESVWDWLRSVIPSLVFRAVLLLAGGIVLFAIWRLLAGRVPGVGWLLIAYILGALIFLVAPRPAPSAVARQTTTATVRAIYPIDYIVRGRNGRGRDLPAFKRYDVVELQFTPPGYAGPVVAVDTVDENTPSNMTVGSVATIGYVADDPRNVRLAGAGRTYVWKNLLGLGAYGLGYVLIALIAFILSRLARRRRQAFFQ